MGSVTWGQTEFQVNLKLGLTMRSPIAHSASRTAIHNGLGHAGLQSVQESSKVVFALPAWIKPLVIGEEVQSLGENESPVSAAV